MENLIVIKESLAKRIIDAGLDCVQVKYAVPAKIAALFEIMPEKVEPEKVVPKKINTEHKFKPRKKANVYNFVLNFNAKKYLSRMTPGSLNQIAADILCSSLMPMEEIKKEQVLAIWESVGLKPEFLKYGTGQMLKAGILVAKVPTKSKSTTPSNGNLL
jgi:hypothetical protein